LTSIVTIFEPLTPFILWLITSQKVENRVVLNFREKRGLGIVFGVGFKQVWGICTLFYESAFVFVISFSCDLLKRKKKEKNTKEK